MKKIIGIILLLIYSVLLCSCSKQDDEVNPFQNDWDEYENTIKSLNENNSIEIQKGYVDCYIGIVLFEEESIEACIERVFTDFANNDGIILYSIYGGNLNHSDISVIDLSIYLMNGDKEIVDTVALNAYWEFGFQLWVKESSGLEIDEWISENDDVYDLKDYRTVTQVDSDGDRLSDKYELCFGLDPNKPQTHYGTDDATYVGPRYWK